MKDKSVVLPLATPHAFFLLISSVGKDSFFMKHIRFLSRAAVVAAMAVASVVAFAQPVVVSELAAYKGDGAERVTVTTAKPGDAVLYVATYKNTGNQPALNLKATLPVPQGMEYTGSSSTSPTAEEASLDGQRFAAVPLTRVVKDASGKETVTPVPLAEYRALRWTVKELAPGTAVSVELPTKVRSAP